MEEQEIYQNPPAALVAIELRHTETPVLSQLDQNHILDVVKSQFPIPQPLQVQKISTQSGGAATATTESLPRYVTRDKMTSITFTTNSVVVETSRHYNFEHLLGELKLAIFARQSVSQPPGLERIGLRYINEIRVPDSPYEPNEWGKWINKNLLGATSIGANIGLEVMTWQDTILFDQRNDIKIVLRHGPRLDSAFPLNGKLQRETPPSGPFYLLDIDGFWLPTNEIPEFESENIIQICNEIHEPVNSLFEFLITDNLRNEVLRRALYEQF